MEERVFRVTPLTPVHVGTGDTYSPEEFQIDGDELARLNLAAILASWSPEQRRRFEQLIEANNLQEARRMVRGRARGRPEFELYRVQLSPDARAELGRAEDPSRRRGEVHGFYRNPVTQQPVLPGSSIKGAIRTAIVNECAAHDGVVRQRVLADIGRNRKTAWQTLEEEALRYERSRTEMDPMRLLRVSDSEFPHEAVRVDRVFVRTRQDREARGGIQMHFERLLARCDGREPPQCRVRLALDEHRMRHPASKVQLKLDWDFIARACEAFYRGRYSEESRQFPWLAGLPLPEEKLPRGGFVLRIGRFCHFESLSVDGLRSGWDVQRRRPIEGMGTSRSAIRLPNGMWAPFGWVFLEPEGDA
jgi:CRISPR-associated protein Csm5